MNRIILIAGPGIAAFNPSAASVTAQALCKSGADVTLIGSGNRPLRGQEMVSAVEHVNESREPVTIFLWAHGSIQTGKHSIILDDSSNGYSTRDFFNGLNCASQRTPVDIFMASSYGSFALRKLDLLPPGSALAILSPDHQQVSEGAILRLADGLASSSFSKMFTAKNLLNFYFSFALQTKRAPSIAKSGEGVSHPYLKLVNNLGKPFSKDEMQRVHRDLLGLMTPKRIDEVAKKIEFARHESSISYHDFGAALAISEAARPGYPEKLLRRAHSAALAG